ncbi:MAG: hypothetical protein SFX73_19020 [Kofleriaceae bacterium]|nr:hypothetical protein [Kofleriaceae bacterium]
MKHVAPLALLALAACPSGDENAPRLWLALDGTETQVRLIDYEPPPF